jgi:hypothetical protein
MKRVENRKEGFLTREKLENPHSTIDFKERLIRSGAIDLENNHNIIDLGNGYVQIVPIDPTKKLK